MAGFSVDLTALSEATEAILDTMNQLATTRVRDLEPAGSAVGHHDMAATLGQFCRRWDLGVENLERDVSSVVDLLEQCLHAYSATDEALAADFAGVVGRPTGMDPGVSG